MLAHITPAPMHMVRDGNNGSSGQPITGVKSFGCGGYHSLVSVIGDTVYSCGLNNYGQLGLGEKDTKVRELLTEVPLLGGLGIVSITGGIHHSLVLTSAGKLWSFGRADSGQLGNATSLPAVGAISGSPVKPLLPESTVIVSIAR